MNCEEAIRLIHLRAGDELSVQEGERLRAHVLSCPECAREERLVLQTEGVLHKLRAATPVLPHPEDLTRSILTGIERDSRHTTVRLPGLGALLATFSRPAFRLGYATVVLGSALLFVFQQADALRSIEALSSKLARVQRPLVTEVRYSMPLNHAEEIVGTSTLAPLLAGSPVSVSDDKITVRKSDLESWGSSLGSRFAARMLASSDAPFERLPEVILDIQKSVTSSLTLRSGGKIQ